VVSQNRRAVEGGRRNSTLQASKKCQDCGHHPEVPETHAAGANIAWMIVTLRAIKTYLTFDKMY